GSPSQPFPGAPIVKANFSRVRLRFSHHGSQLLAVFTGSRNPSDAGLWVMPWPPRQGSARRIALNTGAEATISSADWLLDDRHIILDTTGAVGFFNGGALLLIDSQSDGVWPLTPDNAFAANPAVGPDGRILYVRANAPYDLVETPVDGGPRRDL